MPRLMIENASADTEHDSSIHMIGRRATHDRKFLIGILDFLDLRFLPNYLSSDLLRI